MNSDKFTTENYLKTNGKTEKRMTKQQTPNTRLWVIGWLTCI